MATKYTKWPQNIPNGHKIYQMATKYTKWPQNIPTGSEIDQTAKKLLSFLSRHSKIYPNWNFWFENMYTIWQPCLGAKTFFLFLVN
jgi:hypothetical protein